MKISAQVSDSQVEDLNGCKILAKLGARAEDEKVLSTELWILKLSENPRWLVSITGLQLSCPAMYETADRS